MSLAHLVIVLVPLLAVLWLMAWLVRKGRSLSSRIRSTQERVERIERTLDAVLERLGVAEQGDPGATERSGHGRSRPDGGHTS